MTACIILNFDPASPKRGSGWLKWTIGMETVRPWTEALRNGKVPRPTHDNTSRPNGRKVTCVYHLSIDNAFWQSLLQLGNTRVGDLGAIEVKLMQIGETLKMHQPSVTDLGVL